MDIKVYTSEFCAYADIAKKLLDKHGFSYKVVDIREDEEFVKQLKEETGKVIVPQVVIGSRRIGDYDNLKDWLTMMMHTVQGSGRDQNPHAL